MTNKIEQIMAAELQDIYAHGDHEMAAKDILAALDAAGLGVQPKNPTKDMVQAGLGHLVPGGTVTEAEYERQKQDDIATYKTYWRAFDPTTYEPEPTE